jgi:hypothetical protein
VEKTTNKPIQEEVLQEFAPLGKYRVRLVRNPKRPNEAPLLDIREYVSSEKFEGLRAGGSASETGRRWTCCATCSSRCWRREASRSPRRD